MNRPDKANAVSGLTLDEMDECFTRAADDSDVRVIVLRSVGKHFCAGHDLSGSDEALEKAAAGEGGPAKGSFVDWKERGLEAIYEWETIHYLGYSRRWRDIPKPTIAAVQGQCIAGGLMLCWPCDLIIRRRQRHVLRSRWPAWASAGWSTTATPGSSVPARPRRCCSPHAGSAPPRLKRPAWSTGSCPSTTSTPTTMALAHEISQMHPFALAQSKRAVNRTMDIQGFYSALQAVFDIHQTGHGNALSVGGYPDPHRPDRDEEVPGVRMAGIDARGLDPVHVTPQ